MDSQPPFCQPGLDLAYRQDLNLQTGGIEHISYANFDIRNVCNSSHTQTEVQYAVKVKGQNVVRGGPLSWIPGMRFTLCKFRMSISLAMACSLRLFA